MDKMQKLLPGIQNNLLLKNYSTFRIGGPAKYFYAAYAKEDLIAAMKAARKLKVPFFILGGGSNLLVSAKGFRGLVIKMQTMKYKLLDKDVLWAEAGVPLALLLYQAEKHNLSGLEWAAGIPGTVGGAVYGNAGWPQESTEHYLRQAEVLNIDTLKIKNFSNKECKFGYRDSIFKNKKNLVIISAEFKLTKSNKESISRKIKRCLDQRRKNQPLDFPSGGSIFKNYQLSDSGFQKLIKNFPEAVQFKENRIIPAGWLIEKCGLKGKQIGGAKISEKHANFIINVGGAKTNDVLKLIILAKRKVKNNFGIKLEEEIQYLGFLKSFIIDKTF